MFEERLFRSIERIFFVSFPVAIGFFFKRKEEQNSRGNRFPFAREGENLGERKEVGAEG